MSSGASQYGFENRVGGALYDSTGVSVIMSWGAD